MSTQNLITTCATAVLLLAATSALASGGQAPQRPRGRQETTGREQPPALPDSVQIAAKVSKLSESLQLSADQESQMTDLHFAHFDEVKAVLNHDSGKREDQRRRMESLRSAFEKKVKALLTDEQKLVFEKFAATRRPSPRR